MLYNATNVSRYCRWRQHKGLGGLSAFQQRRVIMADSTTGDGVIRGPPAAMAGTFWPLWILGPFILGFNQLNSHLGTGLITNFPPANSAAPRQRRAAGFCRLTVTLARRGRTWLSSPLWKHLEAVCLRAGSGTGLLLGVSLYCA